MTGPRGQQRVQVSKATRSKMLREVLNSKTVRMIPMTNAQRRAADTMSSVTSKGSPKEIVRISEEAKAALLKRANDEGVPKSDIMRRAIYRELGIEAERA